MWRGTNLLEPQIKSFLSRLKHVTLQPSHKQINIFHPPRPPEMLQRLSDYRFIFCFAVSGRRFKILNRSDKRKL